MNQRRLTRWIIALVAAVVLCGLPVDGGTSISPIGVQTAAANNGP